LPQASVKIAHQREMLKSVSIPVARSLSSVPALFVSGGLFTFAEPRYIFAYYMASSYKRTWSSELWIKHTNIGGKCCQKSTKFWHSIVLECCLAHGFRRERPADISCS
jgi:hypothetical protein